MSESNDTPSNETAATNEARAEEAQSSDAPSLNTPPRAYTYAHPTDHPPVAPVPDESQHEVPSFGGAPEGGT